MSKILSFENSSILIDAPEQSVLREASLAGTNVVLTIDNNNDLFNNDLILLSDIGTSHAEIVKINGAVVAGNQIQIDSADFPHNVGTKITKIKYNKVRFYHSDTVTGAKTLLSVKDLDVDDNTTDFIDEINQNGYGFFTLYNDILNVESNFSSAFPYTLLKLTSKSKLRNFVSKFYKKSIDDDTFDILIDAAEAEIFSVYKWRFREKTATFTSVIGQKDYTFSSIGVTDFGHLVGITYDGVPMHMLTLSEHETLNLNPNTLQTWRYSCFLWDGKLSITPAPIEAGKIIELKYWRNSSGFIEEVSDTDILLPQVLAYAILQELWSMDSAEKSQYWEARKLQTIALLKKEDDAQSVRFAPLTHSENANIQNRNPFDYPSISL